MGISYYIKCTKCNKYGNAYDSQAHGKAWYPNQLYPFLIKHTSRCGDEFIEIDSSIGFGDIFEYEQDNDLDDYRDRYFILVDDYDRKQIKDIKHGTE